MILPLIPIKEFETVGHCFRVLGLGNNSGWVNIVAAEYVRLRTECAQPLEDISVDGIGVLNTEAILKRLKSATIPVRRHDNFDVVRSDFGEILCYMLLEQEYETKFGYKSIRDREITQLPGRGIDAIGIEEGDKDDPLKLILGEAKVSNEAASPPSVVDRGKDCLRNQHLGHLHDLKVTVDKIWDTSRRCLDISVRELLFTAALYLEKQRWDKLCLVACCVLVRPHCRYTEADFGSFQQQSDDYKPALIRFLVMCIPDDVETVVQNWYSIVKRTEVST